MMEIPGKVLESMVQLTVRVGDIFLLEMDAVDGVTPKDGYSSRLKFFVVLGFDGEGNVYGGVIINSKINQLMDQMVKDYHMPLKCEKYPFQEAEVRHWR